VTESSGKRKWVHFRWAYPKFLRQSFHEWAGHSIAQSQWARIYYQQQRSKGNTHRAAVRALAFKWIRIVFHCWQDGVAYDEETYLGGRARETRFPTEYHRDYREDVVKSLWMLGGSHRQGRKKSLDTPTQMSRTTQKSYRSRASDRIMVRAEQRVAQEG